MVDSKRKKRNRKRKRAFNTLFADIRSPEGVKSPALKNLYSFLAQLSSNAEWSINNAVDFPDFDLEICHGDLKVNFEDISELANVIFKEVEERFELLFSKLCCISADKDLVESSLSSDLFDAMEVLNLLFRCCMLLLTLLEARQCLILEKGLIILRILGKLILPNLVNNTRENAFVFEKSVYHECTPENNGCSASSVEGFTASLRFLEPYNPLLVFKTTMLEVFVDELLAHRQLTGYFKIINSAAGINERVFYPCSMQCGTGISIEAICNHFILSFSDKKAFGDFLSQLFCTHAIKLKYPYRAPELGVNAAVSLLLNPIMISAPKYVQAHLISLVSEAIHIKSSKPDRKLSNCFLSTFEKSVCLYMTDMSRLETDGYSVLKGGCTSNSSRDTVYPPFGSYISPETKNKIDTLISKIDNLSYHDMCDSFFRMKSDLVSSSMRFVKECQSVYAISCPEEILDILSCLILKASESCDDNAIRPTEVTTLQHLYLLASILKLMGISLLQAIRSLRHNDDSHSPKTLKEFTLCKEYDFIINAITCFRDLDISLPLQQFLSSQMSSHSMRHVDSKMMFLHISGLISLGFVSGLESLVKACLLAIFAVLNLFVFEEGDLDALKSLVDSNKESSSESPVVRVQETVVDRNYSLVVASKFHKIRSRVSSAIENKDKGESASNMEAAACLEEETEETTNGEIFLKCILKTDNASKFDDLVDFVECEQGKDYSDWLKNRQKYRKRRSEKLAVLKWERKKKTWRSLKGNRK